VFIHYRAYTLYIGLNDGMPILFIARFLDLAF